MSVAENGPGQCDVQTMISVTIRDFEEEVLNCPLPVFACFTTQPCAPCFPLCLLARDLAEEHSGRVKFVTIDTKEEADLADRYDVLSVPTAILFRDSKPASRLLGFHSKSVLRSLLAEAMKDDA